jgi:hypothetical protein
MLVIEFRTGSSKQNGHLKKVAVSLPGWGFVQPCATRKNKGHNQFAVTAFFYDGAEGETQSRRLKYLK